MRTVNWQTLKWRPSRKMYWLKSTVFKQLNSEKVTNVNKSPNRPPSEEKEWLYRSIFDAANDGLIINDLETGLVVEANPAACMMHGYTRAEFIGLQLRAFIHPDSQHVFDEY